MRGSRERNSEACSAPQKTISRRAGVRRRTGDAQRQQEDAAARARETKRAVKARRENADMALMLLSPYACSPGHAHARCFKRSPFLSILSRTAPPILQPRRLSFHRSPRER